MRERSSSGKRTSPKSRSRSLAPRFGRFARMPSLTQPARRVEEVYGLREMIQYDASFVLLGNGVCPPVATGGPRIEDVNGEYQQVFAVVATELTRRHIDNPITYGSLWDWYGRWSTGDLPSYQSRRVFVGELISPLVNRIRTGRVEEVQPTGWQRIDRTVGELRDRLASARNEEQFQAIGLLGRDTLISLAQAVHVSKKHPALDGVEPSSSDGKRKLEAYFAKELADGSNEEARWRIVDEHGVFEGFTRILDFYHAAQHLSMAAEHLFGKASAKADRWYRSWRHKLRHTPNAVAGLIPLPFLPPSQTPKTIGTLSPGDHRNGLLSQQPGQNGIRWLSRLGLDHLQWPCGGRRQDHRRPPTQTQRHAMDPPRRSADPQPTSPGAIETMGCFLELVSPADHAHNNPEKGSVKTRLHPFLRHDGTDLCEKRSCYSHLEHGDQVELAREFASKLTSAGGERLPYTLAVHRGRGENPHAHLMISERANDGVAGRGAVVPALRGRGTWNLRAVLQRHDGRVPAHLRRPATHLRW